MIVVYSVHRKELHLVSKQMAKKKEFSKAKEKQLFWCRQTTPYSYGHACSINWHHFFLILCLHVSLASCVIIFTLISDCPVFVRCCTTKILNILHHLHIVLSIYPKKVFTFSWRMNSTSHSNLVWISNKEFIRYGIIQVIWSIDLAVVSFKTLSWRVWIS